MWIFDKGKQMSIDIRNKIALVTGANRGIGKAIVESFIQHGAQKVYLAVRNLETTNDLVSQYGDKVEPVKADLADPESIEALALVANDVDIVVNNAGVLQSTELLSDDIEKALDFELGVNLYGLVRIAKAFTPILEAKTEAAFVQLNSVASIKNFTDFTSYAASKAASFSVTQGLRDVYRDKGIQVLSVHPGPISTDMAKGTDFEEIAEPASSVSEGIVAALKSGQFLLFPDTMAKQFEQGYQSYAESFIIPVAE